MFATAAALLIAPTIQHRLLFRRGQKPYVLRVGTRFTIAAMAFLGVGLTGILILIAHVIFGGAIVNRASAAGVLGILWFGLPLRRRRQCRPVDPIRPEPGLGGAPRSRDAAANSSAIARPITADAPVTATTSAIKPEG